MNSISDAARRFGRAHVANVLGLPVSRVPEHEALERRVFEELSRTPERDNRSRDQWGNWDFAYGESNLRGDLYVPWVDRLVRIAGDEWRAAGLAWTPEPWWPEGRPFAVCLTHDLDYVSQHPTLTQSTRIALRDAGLITRGPRDRALITSGMRSAMVAAFQLLTLRPLRPRAERSYEEWMRVEERHGFRSTFFVFPEHVSDPHVFDCLYSYDDPMVLGGRRVRVRDFLARLRDGGWEVGLHGSYHSALRPGLLAAQKRQVEDAVGRPVRSTRQHWLHYDVERTPRLQAEAGLAADSTHGFNRNIGFRSGTAFPYPCWDFERQAEMPLLEIPQHVMDGGLFTANALELGVDLAVRHCLRLMDEVQSVSGCLTLSWHPNVLNDARYWEVYETVLAEAARRGAWGASVGQVLDWWTARAARLGASNAAGGA